MSGSARGLVARGLARALLAGEWERSLLVARASEALGLEEAERGQWLGALVGAALVLHPSAPADSESLSRWVEEYAGFQKAWAQRRIRRGLRRWFREVARMQQTRWSVRKLETITDVARWLAVSPEQLAWFADRKGWERRAARGALQHYAYTWVPKRSGGARLLEAPKSNLKRIQRRILHDILDHLPPHPAAYGFRRGISALDHARLHLGRPVVLRFDLQSFFSTVHTGRVLGVFRAAGYPPEVAKTLTALCTNRVPRAVQAKAPRPSLPQLVQPLFELRRSLSDFHLPQGSPTSPALANLVSYGLDVRLARLAEGAGATYSRYADDLTFSGGVDLVNAAARFQRRVADIVRDEGFVLNVRKTRVQPAAGRQEVTGIVVNRALNVRRTDFDRLKASLHGLALGRRPDELTSLRKAQLHGKVMWVEAVNPARGAKLRALFERVAWPAQ